jgi:hypothetical protein
LAISTGDDIFLEISAITSGLSFSASDVGTESASGNTNLPVLFDEFLHEKHTNTTINNKNTLPFIQDDIWINTKIQKNRLTMYEIFIFGI